MPAKCGTGFRAFVYATMARPTAPLRIHSPLSEALFAHGMFTLLLAAPLIGLALIARHGAWSEAATLILVAIPLSFAVFSLEHFILFKRLKLSNIHFDGSFDIDSTVVPIAEVISIEEIFWNLGFKASKYHFLLFTFRTNEGISQAPCLIRDGWLMKDLMTNQSRSLRLLLQRCPELKSRLLPGRTVSRRDQILMSSSSITE